MTRVPRHLLLGVLLVPVLVLVPARAGATTRPVLSWPLAGSPVVDRPFEPPTSAYAAGHRGVDLRAAVGEPVLAADAGRVTYAGLLAGRGVVVVAHAGGLRTTYEPVTAAVRVGQAVARGAVLGGLATGHASCRPGTACLHWGLLRGQDYLDPLSLLGAGPVRLLPLDGAGCGAGPAGAGPAAGAGRAPGCAPASGGSGDSVPAGPADAAAGTAGTGASGAGAPDAAAATRAAVDRPAAALAPARTRPAWSRAARGVGAVAAGGALVLGISLLRPGPHPSPPARGDGPAALRLPVPGGEPEPPAPVDLLSERRRRRSA